MLPPLLRMAINAGSLETVKSLLDQGVDPNAMDADGETILLKAFRSSQFDICQYLLQNGADPKIRSKAGISASDIAKITDERNLLQIHEASSNGSVNLRSLDSSNDDWISESNVVLPQNEDAIMTRSKEFQTGVFEWEVVDRDASWEDVDVELPILLGEFKTLSSYEKIIHNLVGKSRLYGVLDPAEIWNQLRSLELTDIDEELELFLRTEFFLESIGFIVEACASYGYSWDEDFSEDLNIEPEWEEFLHSLMSKKWTSSSLLQRSLRLAKPISREEEKRLFEELRTAPNDVLIRERIILANLRFAYKTGLEYRRECNGVGAEDRISESLLGLLVALDRFDIDRDVKFISYAIHWIRQKIQKVFLDHGRSVRIPPNKISLLRKFKKTLAANDGNVEVALSLEEFQDSRAEIISLYEGEEEHSLEEILDESDQNEDFSGRFSWFCVEGEQESEACIVDLKRMLDLSLKTLLTKREAKVLRMYYGLELEEASTFDEIGTEIKLTRERVRQIKNKSLNKLQKNRNVQEILFPFFQAEASD